MKTSAAYDLTSRILFFANDDLERAVPLARAYCRWHVGGLTMADLDAQDFDDRALPLLRQMLKLPRSGDARYTEVLRAAAEIFEKVAAGGEIEIVDIFRLCQADATDEEDEPSAISARP
jgi:hypothetical protein